MKANSCDIRSKYNIYNRPVLITGGSGFVGSHLVSVLNNNYDTYYTYKTQSQSLLYNTKSVVLDITDCSEVMKVFKKVSPGIVIHCAAVTDFNKCAQDKSTAWAVNVTGTKNVAIAAEKIGARVVYLSTDLVFDGEKGGYFEDEIPQPICTYGITKYEGEKIVSSSASNYAIIRVSLLYGKSISHSHCFAEKLVQVLLNNEVVRVFIDEFRTPIHVRNAAEIISEIAQVTDACGIFHVCGPDRLSRFEFALRLSDLLGTSKNKIIPELLANYNLADIRPRDCSLKCSPYDFESSSKRWNFQEGLKQFIQEIKSEE